MRSLRTYVLNKRNPQLVPRRPHKGCPPHLASAVQRVLEALERHGDRAIVALAGVPGTSKSHVARLAARRYASEGCLREIQFSPGYTYEEFIEGPRLQGGAVAVQPGSFMELNWLAHENPESQYVLLIEEFTRADLPKVLGEVLTFIEYRGEEDLFTTMYDRRQPKRIAPNLAVLATYNPADRSAVSLDAAIIRRLRILSFPPDVELLREMLGSSNLSDAAIEKLAGMFDACRARAGEERFADVMPFGHAVFHSIVDEVPDLNELWEEELRHFLIRPRAAQHELYPTIIEHYPWSKSPDAAVQPDADAVIDPPAEDPGDSASEERPGASGGGAALAGQEAERSTEQPA
jgi:5-methylcytosine-specific restriction protein B